MKADYAHSELRLVTEPVVYKDRVCLSLVVVIRIYRSSLVTGEYQVLCKGAESSVLKKCVAGPIDATIEHVDYYASVSITTPI